MMNETPWELMISLNITQKGPEEQGFKAGFSGNLAVLVLLDSSWEEKSRQVVISPAKALAVEH